MEITSKCLITNRSRNQQGTNYTKWMKASVKIIDEQNKSKHKGNDNTKYKPGHLPYSLVDKLVS